MRRCFEGTAADSWSDYHYWEPSHLLAAAVVAASSSAAAVGFDVVEPVAARAVGR